MSQRLVGLVFVLILNPLLITVLHFQHYFAFSCCFFFINSSYICFLFVCLDAQLKEGVASSKYEEIARAVRDIISVNHGLALSTVCLLKTRSIPKTTSGKIARSWCRRAFLDNSLQVVYRIDADPNVPAAATGADGNEDGDEGTAAGTATGTGAGSTFLSPASKKSAAGGGVGYSKVHNSSEGADAAAAVEAGGVELTPVPAVRVMGPHQSLEVVRQLPIAEVVKQLEDLMLQVAAQGPSPLTAPLDTTMPVSSMGLDSMTLVQFKGVLEKR